jgi:hypothetical protein
MGNPDGKIKRIINLFYLPGVMHATAQVVLEAFKTHPNKEFLTSELLERVYSDEYLLVKTLLEQDRKREATRAKAKLHRKLLHHLKTLEDIELITVAGIGAKGEKRYRLGLWEGEELVVKGAKKRMIIRKPVEPSSPIETELGTKEIWRFCTEAFLTKLDSVLLNSSHFRSLRALKLAIFNTFDNVNDVIGLNDFERIAAESPLAELESFVLEIGQFAKDHDLSVCFILDYTNLTNCEHVLFFIGKVLDENTKNLSIVHDVKPSELKRHSEFFNSVLSLASKTNAELIIKNQELWSAPYIIGKAGAYTFDEQEWELQKTQLDPQSLGFACGHSTIMVDMNRVHQLQKTPAQFRALMLKISKGFLSSTYVQRKHANEYFRNVIKLAGSHSQAFFMFSKNYVRFWNFLGDSESSEDNKSLSLIASCIDQVNNFCSHEETIYKACGIPTRLRIAFSFLSSRVAKTGFSPHNFHPPVLAGVKQLYESELADYLRLHEYIFRVFSGGNKVKLVKPGDLSPEELSREINTMLSLYALPLVSIVFEQGMRPHEKLTDYI